MEIELPISEVETVSNTEETKRLIVFNDDVNSFDHVINCLIKYCKHNTIQAEQCTTIIHYNGKCSVKEGDFDKLLPIYNALSDNGLSVEIH